MDVYSMFNIIGGYKNRVLHFLCMFTQRNVRTGFPYKATVLGNHYFLTHLLSCKAEFYVDIKTPVNAIVYL